MTKLDALKKQFKAALGRFEEVTKAEKSVLIRDAAIKRFEFTFDLAWKLIRAYLSEKKGVDCASPKDCIREAYRQSLIEYDGIWIKMPDWRNEIVHEYSEDYANDLYEKFPRILELFLELRSRVE